MDKRYLINEWQPFLTFCFSIFRAMSPLYHWSSALHVSNLNMNWTDFILFVLLEVEKKRHVSQTKQVPGLVPGLVPLPDELYPMVRVLPMKDWILPGFLFSLASILACNSIFGILDFSYNCWSCLFNQKFHWFWFN